MDLTKIQKMQEAIEKDLLTFNLEQLIQMAADRDYAFTMGSWPGSVTTFYFDVLKGTKKDGYGCRKVGYTVKDAVKAIAWILLVEPYKKPQEIFQGMQSICLECSNGIATKCRWIGAEDDRYGLEYMYRWKTKRDVVTVTRCPQFKEGPIPPLV